MEAQVVVVSGKQELLLARSGSRAIGDEQGRAVFAQESCFAPPADMVSSGSEESKAPTFAPNRKLDPRRAP